MFQKTFFCWCNISRLKTSLLWNFGNCLGDTFKIWFDNLLDLIFWNLAFYFFNKFKFTCASRILSELYAKQTLNCLKYGLVWWLCNEELTNLQHIIFNIPGKLNLKFFILPHKFASSFHLSVFKNTVIRKFLGLKSTLAAYFAILEGALVCVFIGEDMSAFDKLTGQKIAILYLTVSKLLNSLALPHTGVLL